MRLSCDPESQNHLTGCERVLCSSCIHAKNVPRQADPLVLLLCDGGSTSFETVGLVRSGSSELMVYSEADCCNCYCLLPPRERDFPCRW